MSKERKIEIGAERTHEAYKLFREKLLKRWASYDFSQELSANKWTALWSDLDYLTYLYCIATKTVQIKIGSNPSLEEMRGLLWGLTAPIYKYEGLDDYKEHRWKIIQTARVPMKWAKHSPHTHWSVA